LQGLAASKQQQQQQQRGQQQVQRAQLRQQGSGGSSSSSRDQQLQSSSVLRQQQEQDWQQLQQSQPPSQQQHSAPLTDAHAALVADRSVFEAAAAAAAAREEEEEENLGEVFTPFDSPFYQDLDMGSWAPSASVCDSQPNSLGVCMPSGAAAALGVSIPSGAAAAAPAVAAAMSSVDSGTAGGPFVEQLQQAGLRPAAAAAGAEGSFTAQGEGANAAALSWSGEPVLKQAVTIEYHAEMTPMAAAAAEAVSVHGPPGRRSGGTAPGSVAGSRPGSVVGNGPHAAAAAAVAAAAAAGALPSAANCNGCGPTGGSAHGSSSGGGSQADVAASADTCAPAAGAGALGKFPSAPVQQQQHSARSPAPAVSDQQQLRGWSSHMDAPRGAAAGAGVGADAADSNVEPPRPAWMRLLGIRRSLPGGA
jgi:hypothetical protein